MKNGIESTEIINYMISSEAVKKYVKYQEETITALKNNSVQREEIIRNQDRALNAHFAENLALSKKIDVHRLFNAMLTVALSFFVSVYFWP